MRPQFLKKNVSAGTMGGLLAIIVLAIIFMPLAVIWALNTLFGLAIAYGFYEWLAVLVLSAFLQTRVRKND
jgi:hypothetical protein